VIPYTLQRSATDEFWHDAACSSGLSSCTPYPLQRTRGLARCCAEHPMSTMKERSAARVPLVPVAAAPGYAAAMAQLPRVQITKRRISADRNLPAVGLFS
jgi:hypothetical protein